MSQEYFDGAGASKRPETAGSPGKQARHQYERPNYLTVGSGSTSDAANKLQAMLDNDSGYGGSVSDDFSSQGWARGLAQDSPSPAVTPTLPADGSAQCR